MCGWISVLLCHPHILFNIGNIIVKAYLDIKDKVIESQIKKQLKRKKTNALPEIVGKWHSNEDFDKLIKMLSK